MKVSLFALLVFAVVAVSSASAARWPDPRVCDKYETHGAAAHAKYCAEFAGSLLAEKAVVARVGGPLAYWPVCVASRRSLLAQRCYLQHDQPSGPAVSVTWDPVTFRPTLRFGPAGLAWVAELKAKIAAAHTG